MEYPEFEKFDLNKDDAPESLEEILLDRDLWFELGRMIMIDRRLYEQILETPGFAFHFNNICNMARGRKKDGTKK